MKPLHYLGVFALLTAATVSSRAHDGAYNHIHAPASPATPLQVVPEAKGPVKVSKGAQGASSLASGQGYWRFAPVTGVPLPEEIKPFLKGAHGSIIVDSETDTVYWGLEKVGWVAFSHKLTKSWVVKGDPAFASGNIHGADILPRKGQRPLIAAADNVEGEIYLSDTTFQNPQKLQWPQGGPYTAKKEFAPTDVAFFKPGELYVTDGYGKAFIMPAGTDPLKYTGTFIGGKELSGTPHGVSLRPDKKSLLIAARPEGQVKEWIPGNGKWQETLGLPAGSTVCDVDVWGDYALAPCLDGADKSPGPIYILNLKKKTIASVIRPKQDLGFADAQHIHDATWYVTGKGRNREVYILFTNWNPGGFGAVKLIGAAE